MPLDASLYFLYPVSNNTNMLEEKVFIPPQAGS